MIYKLREDRQCVRVIMKAEVEDLMRLGADICQMTHRCAHTNSPRTCVSAKDMRDSWVQDGSTRNIKCLHWIFNQLPYGTHQDVLRQRRSHMDLAVEKVERQMKITWAPMKDGETKSHRNCLQHVYSKILNDKRQTIIKQEGTEHKRKPMVRHPKTQAAANKILGRPAATYKKGKVMFYWSSKKEGEEVNHLVSSEVMNDLLVEVKIANNSIIQQVDYDNDVDWNEWNEKAKMRILLKTNPTPPMAQYFIDPRLGGSVSTPVSSLTASKSTISSGEGPYPSTGTWRKGGSPSGNSCVVTSVAGSEDTMAFRSEEGWQRENKQIYNSSDWNYEYTSDSEEDEQKEQDEAAKKVWQDYNQNVQKYFSYD
jgi:hypothetical protein